ncbi:hypothetical protein TNCV_4973261, partial [Trichonephila clavipes]
TAMEMKTQQGGLVRTRKSRGKNDNNFIKERTRSGNRNARRRGDQQREEQERKGASTRRSLFLDVLEIKELRDLEDEVCGTAAQMIDLGRHKRKRLWGYPHRGDDYLKVCEC